MAVWATFGQHLLSRIFSAGTEYTGTAGGSILCRLPGRGEGDPALELAAQFRGEPGAEQGLCGALEGFRLSALAAEAEAVHDAERGQQAHAAAGEALGRGERPGQGQLEHEVCAAARGGLGPGELRPDRSLAALDKVAGHGADHGGVRSQRLPRPVYEQLVSVVKGVEFRNDAGNAHRIASLGQDSSCVLPGMWIK